MESNKAIELVIQNFLNSEVRLFVEQLKQTIKGELETSLEMHTLINQTSGFVSLNRSEEALPLIGHEVVDSLN